MDIATDPRPLYSRALAFAADLVDGVRPDQLTDPTPCDEFDVRTLLGHLLTTARRARVIAGGGSVAEVPPVVTDVPDAELAATYRRDADAALAAWADDALLEELVSVPWGSVPGAGAIWGYLNETLVHGWDLAVATGQPSEADPDLAGAALAAAQRFIPAGPRDPEVPFADAVSPAPGAGPTEQLANWSGRTGPA